MSGHESTSDKIGLFTYKKVSFKRKSSSNDDGSDSSDIDDDDEYEVVKKGPGRPR